MDRKLRFAPPCSDMPETNGKKRKKGFIQEDGHLGIWWMNVPKTIPHPPPEGSQRALNVVKDTVKDGQREEAVSVVGMIRSRQT